MKNYTLILLFILVSVSCAWKQRENSIVLFNNYSKPETLIIETNCPFLTDDQFNQTILDTIKMQVLDRNVGIQIKKVTYKLVYNVDYEDDREIGFWDIKKSYVFLYRKLNLQTGVNSLIVFMPNGCFVNDFEDALWLFNIKNNQLCSIVLLRCGGCYGCNDVTLCPYICVKNKVFTITKLEGRYFLPANFGDRLRLNDKKYFSTFKIDENGFLEFTKN